MKVAGEDREGGEGGCGWLWNEPGMEKEGRALWVLWTEQMGGEGREESLWAVRK